MKKILITGSSGMVGRNFIESNKCRNFDILSPSSKELNLLNKNQVFDYLKSNKPDLILHCAAKVGGIQANIENPIYFLVDNTQMGLNIITTSYELGIKNLINIASSCMYPKDIYGTLSESLILKGELEPTNEGYAISKIFSTRLCEYISRNPAFRYKTVIPCNLYGKYDKFDPSHSHMIPAVIKKIHDAKEGCIKEIDIWGDGEARREFLYIEDFVDFLYYAIENFDSMPQNINVGLGYDYTINEYYYAIMEVVGYNGHLRYDLSKPVGMRKKLVDNCKMIEFGWNHKTSLKDGIRKTYEYYLSNI